MVKRPRGRPKKVVDDVDVVKVVSEEPKKRGRPKKAEVSSEPGKRGRPKKVVEVIADSDAPKKRGRPKKSESLDVKASAKVEAVTEPKKRGRPKKNKSEEAVTGSF